MREYWAIRYRAIALGASSGTLRGRGWRHLGGVSAACRRDAGRSELQVSSLQRPSEEFPWVLAFRRCQMPRNKEHLANDIKVVLAVSLSEIAPKCDRQRARVCGVSVARMQRTRGASVRRCDEIALSATVGRRAAYPVAPHAARTIRSWCRRPPRALARACSQTKVCR